MKRPDHPDFELLAAAVRDNDEQADAGASVPDIIGQVVDEDVAAYVADQRALRQFNLGAGLDWNRLPSAVKAAALSLWLDGLLAGHKLAKARDRSPDDDGRHRAYDHSHGETRRLGGLR